LRAMSWCTGLSLAVRDGTAKSCSAQGATRVNEMSGEG
jgi:hypothetical protein